MANKKIGNDEDVVVDVVSMTKTAMAAARRRRMLEVPIPNNVADDRRRRLDDNVITRCWLLRLILLYSAVIVIDILVKII